MRRILILDTSGLRRLPDAVAGAEVERRPLPEPDAPDADWDALVAALMAADVVVTDGG